MNKNKSSSRGEGVCPRQAVVHVKINDMPNGYDYCKAHGEGATDWAI